jgi:hypothetical protein
VGLLEVAERFAVLSDRAAALFGVEPLCDALALTRGVFFVVARG